VKNTRTMAAMVLRDLHLIIEYRIIRFKSPDVLWFSGLIMFKIIPLSGPNGD